MWIYQTRDFEGECFYCAVLQIVLLGDAPNAHCAHTECHCRTKGSQARVELSPKNGSSNRAEIIWVVLSFWIKVKLASGVNEELHGTLFMHWTVSLKHHDTVILYLTLILSQHAISHPSLEKKMHPLFFVGIWLQLTPYYVPQQPFFQKHRDNN